MPGRASSAVAFPEIFILKSRLQYTTIRMPSKNSINKPKLAVQQSRKSAAGQRRRSRLTVSSALKAGIAKSDAVVHGRVLSKKQAKKDERNRRYMARRGVSIMNGEVVIKAEDADGDDKMSGK
jgi:hypothetical protein